MKPLPFIIFGVYILLYVLAGFIFGAMPVVNALVVMFILATIIYIWILVEEKPWKFAFVGENLAAYAIMAYGVTFFLIPIVVLNILADLKDEGKITWRWL